MVAPIGFNHDIALALIPAMAAREVAVAAIGTVYAIDDPEGDAGRRRSPRICAARWSLPTALAFLMWFVFAPQCISTIAVTRRETNGWKWPAVHGWLSVRAGLRRGRNHLLARGRAGPLNGDEAWQAASTRSSSSAIWAATPRAESFQNGGKVVNLRIATSETWKDRNTGERKEKTEWHTVKVFNEGLANVAEKLSAQGQQGLYRRRADHPQVAGPAG